jgi:hypothetical protein
MKYQQLVRFEKSFNESFYLINKNKNNNEYIFNINSPSNNIYNVIININNKNIICNCNDFTSHANIHKCICKHCCFILTKVLNLFDMNSLFYNDYVFFNNHFKFINDVFNNKLILLYNYFNNDINSCCICFDNLNKFPIWKCSGCNNYLHENCVQIWINNGNDTCIFCRQKINNYRIRYEYYPDNNC